MGVVVVDRCCLTALDLVGAASGVDRHSGVCRSTLFSSPARTTGETSFRGTLGLLSCEANFKESKELIEGKEREEREENLSRRSSSGVG